MEENCPKCGELCCGEDPKGNGMCVAYYCEECDYDWME